VRLQGAIEGSVVRLTASTNSQGQFEIKEVPAGQYFVSAARAGFLSLQYGQRRAVERGLVVEVTDGARVEGIDISLPRAGVLGGHLTDELGEPYPGVQISALTMRYVNGVRMPAPAGSAVTDDLGQYRIPGLAPGSYMVVATTTETWRNDKRETFGYASTYFPGGSAETAQRVTLAPSQQRLDLDFSMRPSRAVRVSGRALTETGAPASSSYGAQLAYRFGDSVLFSGVRAAPLAGDGSFEFRDVTEGDYTVSAVSTFGESISVRDSDVIGLALTTRLGSAVTGVIVDEDGAPPPFKPAGVRVTLLAPTERVLPTVRVVSPAPDWSFKMTNLGGPFLFRVFALPDGWTLSAVKLGERDITDTPWDVPTGGRQLDGLTVVLTRKSSTLSGTVTDAAGKATAGATLVVFADDEKLWMPGSRFTRVQRPDKDGRFALTGLPSGTYRAIALDYVETGQQDDRAFLDALRDQAARVILADGSSGTLTLKVVAAK